MQNREIILGGVLVLLLSLSMIDFGSDTKKSVKIQHIVKDETTDLTEEDISIDHDVVLTTLDSVLDGASSDISVLTQNTDIESIEKLEAYLASQQSDKETFKELVVSVSKLNNKQSADLLLKILADSIKAEDIEMITSLESAFSNFDSADVAQSFASFLYENDEDIELSNSTKYAIEKVINNTLDRDMVASNLAQMYERLDEDKKVNIITLEHPETMAIIATRAYEQGDMDTYDMMVGNLSKSTKQETLNAFMLLSRKSETDMVNDIAKIASSWSRDNSSKRDMEIAEDYLSRDDTTAHEKMVASSMLSNQEDSEKIEHILNKAMDNQEDNDVVAFISEQLEKTKE